MQRTLLKGKSFYSIVHRCYSTSIDPKGTKSLLQALRNAIKPQDNMEDLLKNSEVKVENFKATKLPDNFEDDDEEWVEMFNKETGEWNGPRHGEPTVFGDWQQKGRTSDFS